MKTQQMLLILLLGSLFSGITAQIPDYPTFPPAPETPSVEGTKTIVWYGDWVIGEEVIQNGQTVDRLYGPMVWHNVYHFKNGIFTSAVCTAIGEIVSLATGERFKINAQVKMTVPGPTPGGKWYFHDNMIGDQGSHYILSGYCDMVTYENFLTKVVIQKKK